MTGPHFTVGARVRTVDFGLGTVVKVLPDGALVRFDAYGTTLLRQGFAVLTLLDGGGASGTGQHHPGCRSGRLWKRYVSGWYRMQCWTN